MFTLVGLSRRHLGKPELRKVEIDDFLKTLMNVPDFLKTLMISLKA